MTKLSLFFIQLLFNQYKKKVSFNFDDNVDAEKVSKHVKRLCALTFFFL